MSFTTSADQSVQKGQKMQKTTTDTSSPGNEGKVGSGNTKPVKADPTNLKPWDIAEKLLPIANGQQVSVEFASDAQFQAWIVAQGVPVDDAGIAEWSFDDRCGVIMYALSCGLRLQFADEKNSETISENNSDPNFLEYAARAKEIMHSNPGIDSAELAQALGISSKLYAHTIKVFVNAQQEGA